MVDQNNYQINITIQEQPTNLKAKIIEPLNRVPKTINW